MVQYIGEITLSLTLIALVFASYMFYIRKELQTLYREKKELEESLSLETTVKSLIEVIRQEINIYVSADIICTTLTTLLEAEGMSVYLASNNKRNKLLGEYFRDVDKKQKYKDCLTNEVINETLDVTQLGNIYIRNIENFEDSGEILNLITIPIQDMENLKGVIAVFKMSDKAITENNITNFTTQVLFYCVQLICLAFDLEHKANIEKLLIEKEKSEKQTKELTVRLEQEIKNNELQNEFIGIISHEFRTPLAIMGSSTKLLQYNAQQIYTHLQNLVNECTEALQDKKLEKLSQVIKDEKANIEEYSRIGKIREQLKNINNYIFKLSTLIESTLNLSIVENRTNNNDFYYSPINTDLKVVLSEVIADMANFREDVKIDFSYDKHTHITYFDSKHLHLILSNIISNAIKFSKPNNHVDVRLNTKDNNSVIEIEDYGIGIPKECHSKLFNKFYRAHNAKTISGTGIGLYISKRLMELNQGIITMQSEPEKGSKFILTFSHEEKNNSIKEVSNG